MPTTAENFVQVGSRDPLDFAALDKALDYLAQSPAARSLIAEMGERGVSVNINHKGVNTVENGVLNWDPNAGLAIVDNSGKLGGVISPAMGFIHEAAHSVDDLHYDPATSGNAQWTNDAERYAGQWEADVAAQLNEPIRENHFGTAQVMVLDVTEHTRPNPDGSYTWVERDAYGRQVEGPAYVPEENPTAPVIGGSGSGDEGGGSGDTGDGGGGGGGGGGCVAITSLLPDGTRAGDIVVGDMMQLADAVTLEKGSGEVTFSKLKQAPGFRITTEKGVSLVCSDTAPIPTRHGLLVPAKLLGQEVPVRWDEAGAEHVGWERITNVESVGVIYVQHITVGDRCFWAGEKPGAYILHHNDKDDSGDDDEGGFYDPLTTGHGNNRATAGSNSHSTAGAAGAGQNLVFASNQATGNDLQFPITQSAPQPPAPADHAVVTHDAAVIVGVAPPVIDPIMLM